MLTEEEILEKVDEKIGDNLYRANGDLFTQYKGKLMNVLELDADVLRDITDYDKVKDYTTGKMPTEEQENTSNTTLEVEYSEPEVITDDEQETAMVERDEQGTVALVDDFDTIKQTYEDFERVKKEILDKDDIVYIQGQPFITRSGRCKISTAFGISTEIMSKERIESKGGVTWIVKSRATTRGGRYAEDMAMCSEEELRQKQGGEYIPEHNILTTAITRSLSRCSLSLLGGNVTKEEVQY